MKPFIIFMVAIVLSHSGFIFASEESDEVFIIRSDVQAIKDEVGVIKTLVEQKNDNAFNPSITVVGDGAAQYVFGHHHADHGKSEEGHGKHTHGFESGVFVRELEFVLNAPIDPYVDGTVTLGLHSHRYGHFHFHVEEAFLRFKKWPGFGYSPLGLNLKLGQFKASFGRMNRVHRHHITQYDYPMAMTRFLGEEGLSAPGLSLENSFAVSEKSALNITIEGMMGGALPLQDKSARKTVMGLLNLWWHQEVHTDHFVDVGSSGILSQIGAGKKVLGLLGGDVHYSYLPKGFGQNPFFIVGDELYSASSYKKEDRWAFGNVAWAQIKLFGSSFFTLKHDVAPKSESVSFEHSVGTYLSYYTSEFLRFRLGYEHVMPKMNSFAGEHRLIASVMFVMGSHPVEPYFITR